MWPTLKRENLPNGFGSMSHNAMVERDELRQEIAHNLRGVQRERFRRLMREHESMYPDDAHDQVRLLQLWHLVHAANRLEPGDYVELGVHRGLTLKFIYEIMDPKHRLYAFDTFEGFDPRDVEAESEVHAHEWKAGNFDPTSALKVASYVGGGPCPLNLRVVQGWFPETFEPFREQRWRFAHVDMDLYQPTEQALRVLWTRMVPGGIIAVHDYGNRAFRVNVAVDAFCELTGIAPVMMADLYGTAVIRKPFDRRKSD